MATRYERWLVARGNVFAPGTAAVAKLIERLRKEGYIVEAAPFAYAVRTVDNTFGDDEAKKKAASTEKLPAEVSAEWLSDPRREEIRLVWPMEAADGSTAKYPLTQKPAGTVRWSLEVHRAPEYVYPSADAIDALDTDCACGEDLEFEWDLDEVVPAFRDASGIFAECEECSRTFDPSKRTATLTNPFDESEEDVPGGAAYRFAIKVDCGSSFVADAKLAFSPALVALVEEEFGRAFYEFGATRPA